MKKSIIFLCLAAVILFNNISVNAEACYSITTGDGFKFNLYGFKLIVYPRTRTDESSSSQEELMNYLRGNGTEVSIAPGVVTIRTGSSVEYIANDTEMNFLNLNTNITTEMLEELLADYIEEVENDTSNTKSYMVDLVLRYSVSEAPDRFNHIFTNHFGKNYTLTLLEGMSGNSEANFFSNIREETFNENIYQVVNMITIGKNEDTGETELKYYTDSEELVADNQLAYYYNYVQFAEEDTEEELRHPKMAFMFTNVTTVEPFKDATDQILELYETGLETGDEGYVHTGEDNTDTGSDTGSDSTTQIVVVPDTALNQQTVIIILGTIAMLLGTIILGKIYLNIEK